MGQQALIIGLGISGQAAADILLQDGWDVIVVDRCAETRIASSAGQTLLSQGVRILEDRVGIDLTHFTKVVVSPGVPRTHPLYLRALASGIDVVGEAQLGLARCQQRCIGITGTNGKTTTALLIAHILQMVGKKAVTLGNIGEPLCRYFLRPDLEEILVVELSSFQLETLHVPIFDAGVILNITADHLDRYSDMREYACAKARLFLSLRPEGQLFVRVKEAQAYPECFPLGSCRTFGVTSLADYTTDGQVGIAHYAGGGHREDLFPPEYKDKGTHDWENALAAWLVLARFGVSSEQFLHGLQSFKRPLHRMEHIATIDGVVFINDSKGTNVDAVSCAVRAVKESVYLIAGGRDKGASYLSWKDAFVGKVKLVIALGEAREKIAHQIGCFCAVKQVDTLEDAVRYAASLAGPGDCVLLSPGCASYDMFRDYVHRGEEFKRVVVTLQKRRQYE